MESFGFLNEWMNNLNFTQESNALYFLAILNRMKGQIKALLLYTSKSVSLRYFFMSVCGIYMYVYTYVLASHQLQVPFVTLPFIFWDRVFQEARNSVFWLGHLAPQLLWLQINTRKPGFFCGCSGPQCQTQVLMLHSGHSAHWLISPFSV